MASRDRRSARLVTVLIVAALTAAACGGATTTGSPSASSAVLASGPLDRSNLAALVATTVPDQSQVGPLAEALSGADRTQVNAAAISPSIPALEAIQDQDAMKALQQLQAKQAAAYSPSGLVQMAAWRPADAQPLQHPSGALLASTETLVIAIVGGAVGAYDPRVDTSPQPLSQDFTDSSGGVDTSMRVTLTTSSGGGRFTAALAVDGDTTKTDPSSGAVVGRVVGTSNFVVSLNPCPDAGGLVSGHIAIEDDETDSGSAAASGSTSVGFKYTGSGDFTTTVNDQADIASTHFSAEVDRAVTSATTAAGSNEPDVTSTDLGLHFDQTVTGSAGGATDAQVTNAQGPVSAEDGRAVAGAFTIGIEVPALALTSFASNVWKGGKCFEIRPSPDGGDVGPGSQTQGQGHRLPLGRQGGGQAPRQGHARRHQDGRSERGRPDRAGHLHLHGRPTQLHRRHHLPGGVQARHRREDVELQGAERAEREHLGHPRRERAAGRHVSPEDQRHRDPDQGQPRRQPDRERLGHRVGDRRPAAGGV